MKNLLVSMVQNCKGAMAAVVLALPVVAQAVTVPPQISGSLVVGGAYSERLAEVGGAINLDSIVANGNATTGDFLLSVSDGDSGSADSILFYPGVVVDPLFTLRGWQISITDSTDNSPDSSVIYLSGTGLVSCVDSALCGSFSTTAMNWTLSAQKLGSSYSMVVTTVPVPAAVWLFGTGLIGLAGVARKKHG